MKAKSRIGIYAGSFDPVHLGHITFALQAIEQAYLDKVYFLPERAPRDKYGYEHFGHRVAMIKRAIKPHSKLSILELEDKTFTVKRTLPNLKKHFKDSELFFLLGSDKIESINDWPDVNRLLKSSQIIVGLRQGSSASRVKSLSKHWPINPIIIESYWPALVSTEIRLSLQRGQVAKGLAKSVASYIRQNWLYISIQ